MKRLSAGSHYAIFLRGKIAPFVATNNIKVRPHRQKFSHTTWYNMVVRYKTCRGSVDSMGDVCRATFYVVRPKL